MTLFSEPQEIKRPSPEQLPHFSALERSVLVTRNTLLKTGPSLLEILNHAPTSLFRMTLFSEPQEMKRPNPEQLPHFSALERSVLAAVFLFLETRNSELETPFLRNRFPAYSFLLH